MSTFGRRFGRKQRPVIASGAYKNFTPSNALVELEAHLESIGPALIEGYAKGLALGVPASESGAIVMDGAAVQADDAIAEWVARVPTGPGGLRFGCATKSDVFTITMALGGESAVTSIADAWIEEAPEGVLPVALVAPGAATVTYLFTHQEQSLEKGRAACAWVLERFAPRLIQEARRQMREEGRALRDMVGLVFAAKKPVVGIVVPTTDLIARLQAEGLDGNVRSVATLRRAPAPGWMHAGIIGHEGGLLALLPVTAHAPVIHSSPSGAPS